jgi:Transposase DDE domain/Transposase domain (DUF772)
MTLGHSPAQEDAFRSSTGFCGARVSPTSIYALLHREGHRLFPDEGFADLFQEVGRASVPPRIVSVVMVLQRLEGLSDREAVDRMTFDLRWKYAAGGLDYDYPGFVHTVLVDMRARLRRSKRPNRIFEAAMEVARGAGLVGRKRVLDSTPLYDAVSTQDTVTLVRSAIRALLRVAAEDLAAELRRVCRRDDDYVAPGKPGCDWDDAEARGALIDALARDAYALLATLDGRTLGAEVQQAAQLLATVVGQDLEQTEDGTFRIARRVAADRVISTVDPQTRHGHKTAARGFDGYKGHVAIDPDSELITATEVTPGNVGDGAAAEVLLAEVLSPKAEAPRLDALESAEPEKAEPVEIYGDASYGTADLVEHIEAAGAVANVKVQAPSAPGGHYGKDAFVIDLHANTVTCPAGVLVQIRKRGDGSGFAAFAASCATCAQRSKCTDAKAGRAIRVHPKEATLQRSRAHQSAATWKEKYRSTRPKIERKLAHLVFRRHGGRRARMRGCERNRYDFALLAAAHNLKRLSKLGVRFDGKTWMTA